MIKLQMFSQNDGMISSLFPFNWNHQFFSLKLINDIISFINFFKEMHLFQICASTPALILLVNQFQGVLKQNQLC